MLKNKLKYLLALQCATSIYASPENKLSYINSKLEQLEKNSEETLIGIQTNLSVKDETNRQRLERAKSYFVRREFKSVASELIDFLNNQQRASFEQTLTAHYLLGESFQHLGEHARARTHYQRYIETYISFAKPKRSFLTSVVQNLLLLEKTELGSNKRSRELISSLRSLDLKPQEKAKVLFYSALTSEKFGFLSSSRELFTKAESLSDFKPQKSEILYYSAILDYQNQAKDLAKLKLKTIVENDLDPGDPYRNLAYLNLGRLYALKKNYPAAIRHLNNVDEQSIAFEQALRALIAVKDEIGRQDEAAALSEKYLLAFPHADARGNIKHYYPLLLLKANLFKKAKDQIESNLAELAGFKEWLTRINITDSKLTPELVERIVNKGKFLNQTPQVLKDALDLFAKLQDKGARLGDIRSELKSLTFHLGSIDSRSLEPLVDARAQQIVLKASQNFALGEELLNIEFELMKRYLSAEDQLRITRSKDRRALLNKKLNQESLRVDNWREWLKAQKLQFRLSKALENIRANQARLSSESYNDQRGYSEEISNKLNLSAEQITASADKTFEMIRGIQLQQLTNQGQSAFSLRYIISLTRIVSEEASFYKDKRLRFNNANDSYLDHELTKAWRHWEHVGKKLYLQAKQNHRNLVAKVASHTQAISTSNKSYKHLKDKILKVRADILSKIEENIYPIKSHYLSLIDTRKSELMKWQADLKLKSFHVNHSKREHKLSKLRQDIISSEEDLKDINLETR